MITWRLIGWLWVGIILVCASMWFVGNRNAAIRADFTEQCAARGGLVYADPVEQRTKVCLGVSEGKIVIMMVGEVP